MSPSNKEQEAKEAWFNYYKKYYGEEDDTEDHIQSIASNNAIIDFQAAFIETLSEEMKRTTEVQFYGDIQKAISLVKTVRPKTEWQSLKTITPKK